MFAIGNDYYVIILCVGRPRHSELMVSWQNDKLREVKLHNMNTTFLLLQLNTFFKASAWETGTALL